MKGVVLFEADYCLLPVTIKNQVHWTKVDMDVAIWAAGHSWTLVHGYARTQISGKKVRLHRRICVADRVDHINRDRLDNRRSNLRPASASENTRNGNKRPDTSSRWRGVSWNRNAGKWAVQFSVDQQNRHVGLFVDEADAATAYNLAAALLAGPFAVLNEAHQTCPLVLP